MYCPSNLILYRYIISEKFILYWSRYWNFPWIFVLHLYISFPQRNNILLYCYFSAILAHGRSSIHGPKVGLSIMGVFVGLLLLAGLFVGVVRFRKFQKRMRAQKSNELSTLRDTVAFSRRSVRVSDLKGNGNGKKVMVIRRGEIPFWFQVMVS